MYHKVNTGSESTVTCQTPADELASMGVNLELGLHIQKRNRNTSKMDMDLYF